MTDEPSSPRTFSRLEFKRRDEAEMMDRAMGLRDELALRRSVREFSSEPIPLEVVRRCIAAAAQAPSGANKQPWTFVLVTDPALKKKIRIAAEEEEAAFYGGRASEQWLEDLAAIGTDEHKPFLETAPALVVVFAHKYGETPDTRNYYVNESVGIASGMLITALHHAGLATLTHTPSPMRFLGEILGRPDNERPYLLMPVGYPAPNCQVPDIGRKTLDHVLIER